VLSKFHTHFNHSFLLKVCNQDRRRSEELQQLQQHDQPEHTYHQNREGEAGGQFPSTSRSYELDAHPLESQVNVYNHGFYEQVGFLTIKWVDTQRFVYS
jgi:hypothetical protein